MRAPASLMIRGDARCIPLADGSVSAVITSPPYFALRRYSGVADSDWPSITFVPLPGLPSVTVPAWRGQLGLEPDPLMYTAHLVLIGREIRRVLHMSGVWWLNLGDSYSSTRWSDRESTTGKSRSCSDVLVSRDTGLPERSLLGIPWRVAFALQGDGWTLRSAPPWVKHGNAMPESVQSRFTTAHEMLFMLAKTDRYYFDLDAIRLPHRTEVRETVRSSLKGGGHSSIQLSGRGDVYHPAGRSYRTSDHFLDSLDAAIEFHAARAAELRTARVKGGAVADEDGDGLAGVLVNPEAFRGSHYAVYPSKLVDIMIRCSTSEAGCCANCGEPWRRAVERKSISRGVARHPTGRADIPYGKVPGSNTRGIPRRDILSVSWSPACTCSPGTSVRRPVVLDCFGGSGTTAIVANNLGRDAVLVEPSAEYLVMARRRLERPHSPAPRNGHTSRRPPPAAISFPGLFDEEPA